MSVSQTISLFEGSQSERKIKKHSSIVQIGNMTTLLERKAMNSLIWLAKDQLKRHPGSRVFQCDIGIIKRLSGLTDSDNADLKDALRNLSNTKIEYNILNKDKTKEERWIFSFLAEVKIVTAGRGKPTSISFEFPSTVLKVIQNPRLFVKLDLLIIRGLNSKHSVALYELMKDYQNLGQYRIAIQDFKRLMGVQPEQYGIFTMLRKRVLDKAIEEINEKTDIFVSYDLEKNGRKIEAILLKVASRSKEQLPADTTKAIEDKLKQYWIKHKTIETLLKKHDLQYLWANITIVEEQIKQGKVSNPVGYLLKAFQNDYRPIETELTKEQKEKLANKQTEERSKKKLMLEEEGQRRAFEKRKVETIKARLIEQSQELVSDRKVSFVSQMNENPLFSKMLQSKWFDDKIIQMQRMKFLESLVLSDQEQDFSFFLK